MRVNGTRAVSIGVWKPGRGEYDDMVAAEEPLEIRVDGTPLAVTLRTPGDDEELAAGFVLTEGVARRPEDVDRVVRIDEVEPTARGNVVDVRLKNANPGIRSSSRSRRARRPDFITAGCGVCGRGTIDAVSRRATPLQRGETVAAARIAALPDLLMAAQAVFAETGGLHAAGLFNFGGRLIVAREDIGRHNAVDKVVGSGLLQGTLPFSNSILMVSGRTGFEIVLKAWIAGIPVLASASAPSHLAVQLAEEADMTLVGFLRNGSFTVYHGRQRIAG